MFEVREMWQNVERQGLLYILLRSQVHQKTCFYYELNVTEFD